MSDVIRIFVEKREGFNVEAKQTLWDIRHNLGMRNVTDLRYIVRYDIEGITKDEYDKAKSIVLSEPNADVIYEETLPVESGWRVFAMEYLPGQYDQRGDSAEQCVQLLTQGERCKVLTARVIALNGDLSDDDQKKIEEQGFRFDVPSAETDHEKPEDRKDEEAEQRPERNHGAKSQRDREQGEPPPRSDPFGSASQRGFAITCLK